MNALFRFLFLICLSQHLWAQSNSLSFVRQVHQIKEYSLPNGLQVLIVPDNSKPRATINITYRVGSRHEVLGEYGAAHLLEHMLFKPSGSGEPARYADSKRSMLELGMQYNGTTSFDRTNYFAHFGTDDAQTPERFRFMIGWLAAMMHQARFTKEDLASEMTVVRNEFERTENEPGNILGNRMRSAAFPYHGYGHPPIGLLSDIESIPFERLQSFYRQHYRPDNATLIVAGKFGEKEIFALIEREFGVIAKPSTALPQTWSTEPVQEGEKNVVLRRSGGQAQAISLYRIPASATKEAMAASMLSFILAEKQGPMERALVEQKRALSQWAISTMRREPGFFMTGIVLPDRGTKTQATYEIDAIAAQAALASVVETYVPTEADLKRVRLNFETGTRALWRNTEGLAQSLSEAVAQGDWRLLATQRELIAQITLDDLQQVAKTYLLASNRTSGLYLPNAENAISKRAPLLKAPAAQDVTTHLASIPITTNSIAASAHSAGDFDRFNTQFSIPFVQNASQASLTPELIAQLAQQGRLQVGGKSGLKIAVLPYANKDNRVHAQLNLRWGNLQSLRGSNATAGWLAPMLMEGLAADESAKLQALSALQLKEVLQGMDVRFAGASGVGFLNATLEFPAEKTVAVLTAVNDVLRRPAFASKEFERHRELALSGIQAAKSNTDRLSNDAIDRQFRSHFDSADIRAYRSHEEWERLSHAATLADLKAHYQRFLSAQHGELSLVGPIELPGVQNMLQKLWGDWASADLYEEAISAYAAPVGEKLIQIQVPDKTNLSYNARIGLAMNQQQPDYWALVLGMNLLSRVALWQEIREKQGLSYGVGAWLTAPWRSDSASIHIQASLAAQNLPKLLQSVEQVLIQRKEKGFTAAEIETAKTALLAQRRTFLSQSNNAPSNLNDNMHHDRPLDFSTTSNAKIQALSANDVNAALAKYLSIQEMRQAVAGSIKP